MWFNNHSYAKYIVTKSSRNATVVGKAIVIIEL